jgi:hypothetical protein
VKLERSEKASNDDSNFRRTNRTYSSKIFIWSVISFFLILFGAAIYKIFFLPTSITFESYPKKIFAFGSSPVKVKVIALNRLGIAIPLKHLTGKFIVEDGTDKIEVLREMGDELTFLPRGKVGRVVVLYYTSMMPFPLEIVLDIRNAFIAGASRGGTLPEMAFGSVTVSGLMLINFLYL